MAFRLHRLFEHIKIIKDCHLAQRYLDTGINSIPSLIWFKDIRGAHLKVNDSFCRAVGKTKADVEGRGHYYMELRVETAVLYHAVAATSE